MSAGLALVFMPAVGEYVIPELLGGPAAQTVGPGAVERVLRQPRLAHGGGAGDALLLVLLLPRWRCCGGRVEAAWLRRGAAAASFLYLPIVLLVATSFNDSRLTTRGPGFSLRWYGAAGRRRADRRGLLSLRMAALRPPGRRCWARPPGSRWPASRRFAARVFRHCCAAPLVLPDVLIGLALLLLFVAVQQAVGFPPSAAR